MNKSKGSHGSQEVQGTIYWEDKDTNDNVVNVIPNRQVIWLEGSYPSKVGTNRSKRLKTLKVSKVKKVVGQRKYKVGYGSFYNMPQWPHVLLNTLGSLLI